MPLVAPSPILTTDIRSEVMKRLEGPVGSCHEHDRGLVEPAREECAHREQARGFRLLNGCEQVEHLGVAHQRNRSTRVVAIGGAHHDVEARCGWHGPRALRRRRRASSKSSAPPAVGAVSSTMVNSGRRTSTCSRTMSVPVRAVVGQWIIRGSSPSTYSRIDTKPGHRIGRGPSEYRLVLDDAHRSLRPDEVVDLGVHDHGCHPGVATSADGEPEGVDPFDLEWSDRRRCHGDGSGSIRARSSSALGGTAGAATRTSASAHRSMIVARPERNAWRCATGSSAGSGRRVGHERRSRRRTTVARSGRWDTQIAMSSSARDAEPGDDHDLLVVPPPARDGRAPRRPGPHRGPSG